MQISEMQEKIQTIFFDFEIIAFELVVLNTRFYWERVHFIGCHYVNKESQDFRYFSNGIFWTDFLSEWSKNLTKILPRIFEQCSEPFNMLSVHKCYDTGLFRHLSNPAFCSL